MKQRQYYETLLQGEVPPELLEEEDMGEAMAESMSASVRSDNETSVAQFAAERLNAEVRIASFSIGGWDTHRGQQRGIGRPLRALAETVLTLREGLGANWSRTTVLAMTEFGRAVRVNGSGGTDHGTGGAMVLAGGALRGGRVLANWPGLTEAALYDRRDLMPTRDLRAYAGWAMHGLFGMCHKARSKHISFQGWTWALTRNCCAKGAGRARALSCSDSGQMFNARAEQRPERNAVIGFDLFPQIHDALIKGFIIRASCQPDKKAPQVANRRAILIQNVDGMRQVLSEGELIRHQNLGIGGTGPFGAHRVG